MKQNLRTTTYIILLAIGFSAFSSILPTHLLAQQLAPDPLVLEEVNPSAK